MSKFVTFDQSDNPLLTAAKKMDFSYVTESEQKFSLATEQSMVIAMFKHGDFAKRLIWSPNWEEVGQRAFPSGYQFTVHETSPVIPALFSPDSMFAHAMAFPLSAGVSCNTAKKSDQAVDHTYFAPSQQVAAIGGRLKEKFGGKQQLLGAQDTSYTGIFATKKRTEDGYISELWVAAQSSSNSIAERAFELIESNTPDDIEASLEYGAKLAACQSQTPQSVVGIGAPPHVTWKQLFVENTDMARLDLAQRQHCAKTLLHTLKACGLGPVAASTDQNENIAALLQSSQLVESKRNCVDHVVSGRGELAYLSEMISLHSIRPAGILVRETPQLGPTVIRGPWRTSEQAAQGVVGFPYSVGRRCSTRAHNRDPGLDFSELTENNVHIWDSNAPLNTNLSRKLHRRRNDQWRSIESKLGLADTSTEINLEPVFVVLAPTEQPQRAGKK